MAESKTTEGKIKHETPKMSEDEVKKKYFELQEMEEQMREIHQQIQAFEKQLLDLHSVSESLDDLKNVPPGSSALIPLYEGMYLPATLTESGEIVVGVGAGAYVPKTVDQVKQAVQEQQVRITEIHGQMQELLTSLVAESKKVHQFLAKSLGLKLG